MLRPDHYDRTEIVRKTQKHAADDLRRMPWNSNADAVARSIHCAYREYGCRGGPADLSRLWLPFGKHSTTAIWKCYKMKLFNDVPNNRYKSSSLKFWLFDQCLKNVLGAVAQWRQIGDLCHVQEQRLQHSESSSHPLELFYICNEWFHEQFEMSKLRIEKSSKNVANKVRLSKACNSNTEFPKAVAPPAALRRLPSFPTRFNNKNW